MVILLVCGCVCGIRQVPVMDFKESAWQDSPKNNTWLGGEWAAPEGRTPWTRVAQQKKGQQQQNQQAPQAPQPQGGKKGGAARPGAMLGGQEEAAATSEGVERAIRSMIGQGRLGKGVDLLIESSKDESVAIPKELVNFVLYNCMVRKDWSRALSVIEAQTLKVDNVGFTMAIKACGKAYKWKEVRLTTR
jgi:hypothetical protein